MRKCVWNDSFVEESVRFLSSLTERSHVSTLTCGFPALLSDLLAPSECLKLTSKHINSVGVRAPASVHALYSWACYGGVAFSFFLKEAGRKGGCSARSSPPSAGPRLQHEGLCKFFSCQPSCLPLPHIHSVIDSERSSQSGRPVVSESVSHWGSWLKEQPSVQRGWDEEERSTSLLLLL